MRAHLDDPNISSMFYDGSDPGLLPFLFVHAGKLYGSNNTNDKINTL